VSYPPISDYGLLSDCHSAALVSRDGSVDWCCFHRFDARPVFARLLDRRRGGYCRLAPTAPYRVARQYVPGTNVLETRFDTGDGVVVLTDCLPMRSGDGDDDDRPLHPFHQLLRVIRAEEGEVTLRLELHPRFDYGLTVPRLELHGPGTGIVFGGADGLVVDASFPLEQTERCGCDAEVRVAAGDDAYVAVTYELPHELEAARIDRHEVRRRVDETVAAWQQWSGRCRYDGPYRDAVVRSALVLKALTNEPTGAIVAAPTTSLPELVGGPRNWDYRYAWLRDAALNLYALFRLGYDEEARAFMGWLRRTTAGRADQLQPLYGVGGERLVPEVELAALDGYRGSRPVRVGNAAAGQLQLDVYGELLDTVWLYHRHGGAIDDGLWELVCEIVDVVEARWVEPDEGIWEVRDQRRHFVTSKVMAWVAVDRAIRLARAANQSADTDRWRRLRRAIRSWIDENGVDDDGAFVRAQGTTELDASTLLLPLVRFTAADDPRMVATVERIATELTVSDLVYRYRCDDGLSGDEGAFVICTFWLVDNLALLDRHDDATRLFDRVLGCANDLGLLAEQIDPATDDPLGNFPQAFSHVGLIGAALNLADAASGDGGKRSAGV